MTWRIRVGSPPTLKEHGALAAGFPVPRNPLTYTGFFLNARARKYVGRASGKMQRFWIGMFLVDYWNGDRDGRG